MCWVPGLSFVDLHRCGLGSAQRQRQQQRQRAALNALPSSADAAGLHGQLLCMQRLSGNAALGELGDGLEAPVQLLYLLTLLGFLVVGAYLVVRQACIPPRPCHSCMHAHTQLLLASHAGLEGAAGA
jgi:hypothetical protein